MLDDVADYLLIPFVDRGRSRAGVDCWGLVWLVYREMLGIELPSYRSDYPDVDAHAWLAELVRDQKRRFWQEVYPVQRMDVALFAITGQDGVRRPCHVGLVLDDEAGLFLHAQKRQGVGVGYYRKSVFAQRWAHRFLGAYRRA
jgi:cell wall-associated NlpC family hydrolase